MLFKYLETGNRCDIEFKASQNQRLHTELALLKMCALSSTVLSGNGEQPAPSPAPKPVAASTPKPAPVPTSPAVAPAPAPAAKPTVTEPPLPNASTAVKNQPSGITGAEKKSEEVNAPATTRSGAGQAPSRTRSAGGGATVSISRNLNPKKEESAAAEEEQFTGTQKFSEEEMILLWKKFADKIHAEGRKQLAVALNKHQPVLLSETSIEIPVDNNLQAEEIHSHKTELLAWMKRGLNNGSITIQSRVVEENELKETAYTPAEKFNKMAEKNPDLNQLRSQFDLELDF